MRVSLTPSRCICKRAHTFARPVRSIGMNLNKYGLHPKSDLSTTENAVSLFHMWNDLRMKQFLHLSQTGEMLPSFIGELVHAFGGRYTDEELWEAWNVGDIAVNGEDDYDYDKPLLMSDEEAQAIADDFFDFVQKRHAEREAEREVLAMMEKDLFG